MDMQSCQSKLFVRHINGTRNTKIPKLQAVGKKFQTPVEYEAGYM